MKAIDGDALQEKLTKKKPGPTNARYTEGFNDALLRFKSMIHTAPIIEPERKKGKWVDNTYCSECGWVHETDPGFIGSVDGFNFCPNCGSYNGGENDDKGE